MTVNTAVPYDRNATSLPDKNGTPVHVGDYVRLDSPLLTEGMTVVKVTGLMPREAHEPGNLHQKLGTLDMWYSYVNVTGYHVNAEPWPNVRGEVTAMRSLAHVERVDMTPDELRARRAQEIGIALSNIDHRLAHFNGLRRQYEAELENLR
jgi:hypothetical protein